MKVPLPCRTATLWAALCGLLACTGAAASEQIAAKAGCAVCHAAEKPGVGPAWKAIAAKYKGRADAVALLSGRVRQGSTGVWGKTPMPGVDATRLSDDELKAVVRWVLQRGG